LTGLVPNLGRIIALLRLIDDGTVRCDGSRLLSGCASGGRSGGLVLVATVSIPVAVAAVSEEVVLTASESVWIKGGGGQVIQQEQKTD
jgi:hypothetical protein